MKLIIPTFNRSAKLHRTLEYYNSVRESINCEIIILDGSTDEHAIWNKKNVELSEAISYFKFDSELPFLNRVLKFLESCPEDELIVLGNDEDVFLPSYIKDSETFMLDNLDYSSYIGRYITLCRPILSLNRISHFRDYITINDIDMVEPYRRLTTLLTMVLVGCSPVFFSVRRNNQLIQSIKCQLQMDLESTQELVDQASLALTGKIKFVDKVMILRDETNLGYRYYETRHDPNCYITAEDLPRFKKVLLSQYASEGLSYSLDTIMDWWLPIKNGLSTLPGIAFTRHKNTYSSYRSLYQDNTFLEKIIRNISKSGIIIAQILSWFFIKRELLRSENKTSISIFLRKVKTHGKYRGTSK